MSWTKKKTFVLLLLGIVACRQSGQQEIKTELAAEDRDPSPLIEAGILLLELKKGDIALVDFRKKEDFLKGHLPEAINIWRADIENTDYHYGGMMASKEQIETLFSRLGIRQGEKLVIYDDRGSCDAARLWWLLSNYGFTDVQLLNGGLRSWEDMGGQITTDFVSREPSAFVLPVQSEMPLHIGKEELSTALTDQRDWLLLDTRSHSEFSGKRKKLGTKKAGRIDKSIWIDWSSAVEYDRDMRFKSKNELESIYGKLIKSKEDTVITYCHTGVRSAHTTFVLAKLLGYRNVRNYDGSWTEWSHYDGYPFEKDSITVILQ